MVHKVLFQHNMLKPVRVRAGLGQGARTNPLPYFINDSESINALIKRQINHKGQSIDVFVGKMEELARSQEAKLQEPVIGICDLKLSANAKRFEISQTTWFSMPEERRRAHLKKFSESFQPFAEENSRYDTQEVTAIPDETHCICVLTSTLSSSSVQKLFIGPDDTGI